MTDPRQEAERILHALYESTYRKGGDQIYRRERRCQVIVDVLLSTRQEAFEEAARIAENYGTITMTPKNQWKTCKKIAAALRAQAAKP